MDKHISKCPDQVRSMFDRISTRYDLLNRLLSFRRDVAWRRALVRMLPQGKGLRMLDLATGTGDVICAAPNDSRWVGLDMSQGMIHCAQAKCRDDVDFVLGDACGLPFATGAFDAITIAFGIRNVSALENALLEMRRVLRPGGHVLILEFSMPEMWLIRQAYLLYFRHVLPVIGGLISGDSKAYRYLNRSVEDFPYGQSFCDIMSRAGLKRVECHTMTFGVATLYVGYVDAD